jgi:hypothetical protein
MRLPDIVAMLDPSDPAKAGQMLGRAIAQISYDDPRVARRDLIEQAQFYESSKEAAAKMIDGFEAIVTKLGFEASDIDAWRAAANGAYFDAFVMGRGLIAVH